MWESKSEENIKNAKYFDFLIIIFENELRVSDTNQKNMIPKIKHSYLPVYCLFLYKPQLFDIFSVFLIGSLNIFFRGAVNVNISKLHFLSSHHSSSFCFGNSFSFIFTIYFLHFSRIIWVIWQKQTWFAGPLRLLRE